MSPRARAALAALTVAAAALAACGSSPAWRTWHSASCDSTFEMIDAPESGRSVAPTAFGEVVLTTHATTRPDGSRLIYGCRAIPPSYFATRLEHAIASEVLTVEVDSFDATWQRGAVTSLSPREVETTLTDAAGETAVVRVLALGTESRSHATIALKVGKDMAKRFASSIHVDPEPARPVKVRSAECLSEVTMPAWPTGTAVPGVLTHLYKDADREYQLRCLYLIDSLMKLTPAELFARVEADTVRDTGYQVTAHTDLQVADRYARDYVLTAPDQSRVMVARIVVDGDRLQAATFTGPAAEAATGKRFLATLALLHPPIRP